MDPNNLSTKIYILIEISDEYDTELYVSKSELYLVDIIKNYKFLSNKSLVNFLKNYEESIINNIPSTEYKILESLEKQNFLGYLNIKWYQNPNKDYEETELIDTNQILDIALKYKAINMDDIYDYIMEEKNGYNYVIHVKSLS